MQRHSSCRIVLTVTLLAGLSPLSPGWGAEPERVQFNRDVRPILSANCLACHGRDGEQRQADLRLDVAEGATADLGGHVAIRPGNLSESELWARINSDDPDVVMPPPSTKRTLTAAQKDVLRRWIEQGADYEPHWAFVAPTRPEPPTVANVSWVVNPIDRFTLARLEAEGLAPQPEADRETLIRRVAFALTGLPPTIAEVELYLADTTPQAYENMLARYLASPRYGEEQARHWLDVARYADTHGLHLDNEREMWAYRDWVVRAFNENLPFDQFTLWQLAGDLLPEPSQDQLIATGFNRCNVSTSEGGSIEAEWVFRNAVDRTSAMVQAFLGLTGGCAVCHDHKYDPLSQREFYSLYAFFHSAADPGLDGNIRTTQPFLKVPAPEQAAELQRKSERVAELRRQLDEQLAAAAYHEPAATEAASDTTPSPDPKTDPTPEPAAAALREFSDVIVDDDFPFGAKATNTSRNAATWVLDPKFQAPAGRRVLELASSGEYDVTLQLNLIPVVAPPQAGRLELWVRVDPDYPPAAFAVQVEGAKLNRRAVWGDVGQLTGKSEATRLGELPAAGEWQRLTVPLDKLEVAPETRIKTLVFTQTGGRLWLDDVTLRGENVAAQDPRSSFEAWCRASQGAKFPELSGELQKLLQAADQDWPPEQRAKLLQFYLRHVQRLAESPVADARRAWELAELDRQALDDTIPGTFIFRDLEAPRESFVMLRGQYDKPGEKVEPGVPEIFPPLPTRAEDAASSRRATRLDLAAWLVAPQHPLTARVAVNRIWQQAFGTGLVKTSFDFGSQGELPSHPELLDWLAVEYRESGWDTKHLWRLLLRSATFRQQATRTPELATRDPENRWLARGPRFRLDAEQIRDNALFVGGLLDLTPGGRGVLPYQPPNIWEPVGYQNSNTRYYLQGQGADLYRRSLYCFLKRTAPPPFMSNFDGPNREQVCARRERSNTPLQALQLMNDVQHFEAARGLAERVLAESGPDLDERINYLFRVVLSRRPTDVELGLVREAYAAQHALFAADSEAARRAVEVGESAPRHVAPAVETAAWTMLANMVLNLDETVTRN